MPQAQELMLEQGRRHRAHPLRFRPAARTAATPTCSSWSTAPTPIAPASSRATPRARSASGRRDAPRRARRRRRRPVVLQSRLWFNEANDSHYFLVPGLIVLVMTLIGALLTALVMAREWERGTFEALFVTPVRADEILLGKMIPYFAARHGRARAVHAWPPSSCFTCRCAARFWCWPASRCSICWWRSASGF